MVCAVVTTSEMASEAAKLCCPEGNPKVSKPLVALTLLLVAKAVPFLRRTAEMLGEAGMLPVVTV